jgi:hypothetical protein
MGFNFTEEDLSAAGQRDIFNGGKAGKVKGVKVYVHQAGSDYTNTNDKAPQFKVIFEDASGFKTNRALFSIKEEDYPNMYGATYEQAIKKEWAFLNKLVEHTGGTKVMSFANDTDLYTKVKASMGAAEVNVFANYGSAKSPKAYIEVRKWLPAVEAGDTADADSKLIVSNLDQMAEIVADSRATETEADVEDSIFG